MFKKFVTTLWPSGRSSVDQRGTVPMKDIDLQSELRRVSQIAVSEPNARIQSVEETDNTIVVIYKNGQVKVFHWVLDESEEV